MRKLILRFIGLAVAVVPSVRPNASYAQQNPFKIPKPSLKGAEVTYSLTGNMQGTATAAFDGERYVRASKSTMKMMGKTSTVDSWVLSTSDSLWRADLTKKQGYVSPNLLPYFAKAYDGLDGDGKKRFHQNVQDMSAILSQGLGLQNVMTGEKLGKKTYAGQECDERKLGSFTVCQMEKAPVVLHTSGNLVCLSFEETATSVKLDPPGAEAFAPPPGIAFQPDPNLGNPDSLAKGYVGYLASQQLADSLAKAKAEMEKAKADAAAKGQPAEPTPEQQAAMQSACEAMMSIDMGKVMADAAHAWERAMLQAVQNEAKNQAVKGVKGLLKKPKIP
jgi:hypothetical protein